MITIAEPRYKCTDCSFSGFGEQVPTCAICNRMICPNCSTYQFTHLPRVEPTDSMRYLMQLRLCMSNCWDSIATEMMALVDHRRRSLAEEGERNDVSGAGL